MHHETSSGGQPRADARRGDTEQAPADKSLVEKQRALQERARELGATAEELEAALEALALQAEAVLHRLRGGRLH